MCNDLVYYNTICCFSTPPMVTRATMWAAIFILAMILVPTFANVVHLSETVGCDDINIPSCQLSFHLDAPVTQATVINIPSSASWLAGIESIAAKDSRDGCEIVTLESGFNILFLANQQATVCTFNKKPNTLQAARSITQSNGGQPLVLPPLAYTLSPLEFTPNDQECSNVESSTCQGTLHIPTAVATTYYLDTTSTVSFTCSSAAVSVGSAQIVQRNAVDEFGGGEHIVTQTPVMFNVNRYSITIGPSAVVSANRVMCNMVITKGTIAPFFKMMSPLSINAGLITVYETSAVIYSEVTVSFADNCETRNQPLCTIYYNNIPIEHFFIAGIPSFPQLYDNLPVLDTTYVPPADRPLQRRYLQRLIKSPTATANNSAIRLSAVNLYSPILANLKIQVEVQEFAFTEPLIMDYDEDLCADPLSPICPLRITSHFIGRPITITLSRLPLSGVLESIKCGQGMYISPDRPLDIVFIATDAHNIRSTAAVTDPPLSLVEPLENDDVFECVMNIAKPFDGNDWNNPSKVADWTVSQVLMFYPTKQWSLVNIPLPELRRDQVRFNALPMVLAPHAQNQLQHEPHNGYTITMSLTNPAVWMTNSTTPHPAEWDPEERQEQLNKIHLRSFSVPVFNLKVPEGIYGQDLSNVMNITVLNSDLVLAEIQSVQWKRDVLGYDIVTIIISTYNDVLDFDQYFKQNANGDYLNVIIHFQFDLEWPTTEEAQDVTRHDKLYNVTLLSYNGVENLQNPPVLYASKPGDFYWVPLFQFSVDQAACSNKRVAFCPLNCRLLTVAPRLSGISQMLVSGLSMHSLVIGIPTIATIDASGPYSSQDVLIQQLGDRVDPISGKPSDMVYLNVTLPPYSPEDVAIGYYDFKLFFVKRLGVLNTIVRFQAISCIALRYTYADPEQTILTKTEWLPLVPAFYYSLSNVQYIGDAHFTFLDDCKDQSSLFCTTEMRIYTNNLLPGTELILFDASFIMTVFFRNSNLMCDGIEGISREESSKYVLAKTDPIAQTQRAYITSVTDDKFSVQNPLRYDPTQRAYISCTIPSYKVTYLPVPKFVPLLYVNNFHGVDYLKDPKYNIYPVSRLVDGLPLRYGAIRWNHFDMEPQDDCYTAFLNDIRCTLKFTSNATPKNPIDLVRTEIPVSAWRSHGVLGSTLALADQLYDPQYFCPQFRDTSADLVNDPGSAYGFSIDKQGVITIPTALTTSIQETIVGQAAYAMRDAEPADYFGLYVFTYHPCNATSVLNITITLASKYRTSSGSGYLRIVSNYKIFEQQKIVATTDRTVFNPIPIALWVNVPHGHLPPDSAYPGQGINPNIVKLSPARRYFPAMIYGRIFGQSLAQQQVAKTSTVNVTYTFDLPNITSITIDTILGDFSIRQNYLWCNYTYNTGEGTIRDTLGYVSTSFETGQSILKVNTALLNRLLAARPAGDDRGIDCMLELPINHVYPLVTSNVKHIAQLSQFPKDEFYSFFNFPHHKPSASLHDINENDRYISAAIDMQQTTLFAMIISTIMMVCIVIM